MPFSRTAGNQQRFVVPGGSGAERASFAFVLAMNNSSAQDCQCLCGAVRFTILQPLHKVQMCHCGLCRRWTSGAPIIGGGIETASITAGNSLRWYASSAWGERGFCADCGSSLFWRQRGAASNWVVCVGALPSADGLQLAQHIYIEDKPAYYDLTDDVPRLTGVEFITKMAAEMPMLKRWAAKVFILLLRLKSLRSPPAPLPGASQRGRCICGSVRFRLLDTPQHAYMCHCGQCRRWSGSLGVIGIETSMEAIVSDDTLRWHQTSENRERGFCGQCGTPLFLRSPVGGDIRHVCVGALEDSSGLKLHEHLYLEEKPAYYDLAGTATG